MDLRRIVLGVLSLACGVAGAFCGGTVDDGWNGLTAGGDVDALAPLGSPNGVACGDFHAPITPAPCDGDAGATAMDQECQQSLPAPPPLGTGCAPLDRNSSYCVAYPPGAPPCKAGPEGDAYCHEFFRQFIRGNASFVAQCPNHFPDTCQLVAQGECNGQFSRCAPWQLCVARDAGWTCESPCQ